MIGCDLVSIVIPCYNHGMYLSEAVSSVLNSKYSPIEIIIVDDGSKDHSLEIGRSLAAQYSNVFFISQVNQGPSVARNRGIQEAHGDYILPLDADDKISDQYIGLAIDTLKNAPGIKVVYCNAHFFGMKEEPWKLKDFSEKRLAIDNMIFSCAMFRKKDWNDVGGYSAELVSGWEDWEFWISMLKNGGKAYRLDYTGFCYRIHQHSRRKSTTRDVKRKTIDFINVKHRDFMVAQLNGPLRMNRKWSATVNAFYNLPDRLGNVFDWHIEKKQLQLEQLLVQSSSRFDRRRKYRTFGQKLFVWLLSVLTYFEEWL